MHGYRKLGTSCAVSNWQLVSWTAFSRNCKCQIHGTQNEAAKTKTKLLPWVKRPMNLELHNTFYKKETIAKVK